MRLSDRRTLSLRTAYVNAGRVPGTALDCMWAFQGLHNGLGTASAPVHTLIRVLQRRC